MLNVETTTIIDATKYLSCSNCPLHNNCNKYALICDFIHHNLYFSANLLCVLERAENNCLSVKKELMRENFTNITQRVETLYKDYLPTLNNLLEAFYRYECENTEEYYKHSLILALAESLEYYNALQYFDFMYSRDIENTRDILLAQFEYEMTKSENEKLFKC